MKKFKLKFEVNINNYGSKLFLSVNVDLFNYEDEFKEITELLQKMNSKDLGLIDLSYAYTVIEFDTREDVYKYILENSKDLVELGARLEIRERKQ